MADFADKQRHKRGMHPNSLANLKPFQKGGNANPKGRPPKDVSLTSLLKAELEKIPAGEKQGRTWRQLLVLAWLTGAMKNPALLKELLERIEGKVTQPISGGGEPVLVEVVYTIGKGYANGGGVGHAIGQAEGETPSGGHPGAPFLAAPDPKSR